ncbi:MAG TPA: dihydrofolate reductase [Symbiobacteriaceae bacterium]|jgi:dihydrofolate reductase|nr:dihydrofolate reductase [Symbiobacteriaceae bacterium]
MIALVWAMGRNRVIGKDGKMPWYLSADLIHFRKLTRKQVVVMGRKTYESMGGALPKRTNIVLTRDPAFAPPDCEVIHSIDQVLRDERPIFVIGGAEVYRQFLPHAHALHVTRIHADFEGDTFFPEYDESEWELTSSTFREKDEKNPYDCTFEVYARRT